VSAVQTIDEARWAILGQFAVPHANLRALEERLDADFTVGDYGYAQLADLTDVRLRAVVSDQVLRTAHAVADNLLAACMYRERLDELAGGGRVLPRGQDAVTVLRESTAIDGALASFFGSLPSALDCLAGVAIGVCRLPRSITKADVADLNPLSATAHASGTAAQQATWADLATLVSRERNAGPTGWFDWLMAMRNLLTHRARQQRILLQQTIASGEAQLAVVTDTPSDVTDTWRFDLHLRKRPSLSDMQDFTLPGAMSNLWIAEPATDTVPGVLMLAGGLVDAVAGRLLVVWEQAAASPADFPAPLSKWTLEPEPGPSFDGMSGVASAFRPAGGVAHGQLQRRLDLAARVLRDTRPGASTP